ASCDHPTPLSWPEGEDRRERGAGSGERTPALPIWGNGENEQGAREGTQQHRTERPCYFGDHV
ncbi:MAG: hypothetical protein P8X82_16285, partial [Gemmatimonadales bacterium]